MTPKMDEMVQASIEKMRQARQARLDAYLARQTMMETQISARTERRRTQLEISQRGFDVARQVMADVAGAFGWALASQETESAGTRWDGYHLPALETGENYVARVVLNPFGPDEEKPWIPRIAFEFPGRNYAIVMLSNEEMTTDLVDDEKELRRLFVTALTRAYVGYTESDVFPAAEEVQRD